MKKYRAARIAIILLWIVLNGTSISGAENKTKQQYVEDNIVYHIEDGEAVVSGYQGEPTEIVIPQEVNGVKVVAIGESAFYRCDSLMSIKLPEGLKAIYQDALTDTGIEELHLPSTCTTFEDNSLFMLKSVTVEEENPIFRGEKGTLLKKIHMEDSITGEGKDGYELYLYPISKKATVYYPSDEVIYIDGIRFQYHPYLKNVDLGKAYVDHFAKIVCSFTLSEDHPYFTVEDGVVYRKQSSSLAGISRIKTGEVVVRKGTTDVESEAAYESELSSIIFPKEVTSIGANAFYECSNLETIYFKRKIPKIESDAFSGVHGTVYYSEWDNQDTAARRKDYGGELVWKPYEARSKQTINATSKYTKTYGSKAISLRAKTSGNGKLTYTSSNKKIATVSSNGKVTIKGYGTATITIKAGETDEYLAASKKVTIKVIPKKMILKSLASPSKKKIKFTWKKDSTVTGYQVYVSTKKDFSKYTKSRFYGRNVTSQTVSGCTSKKTYYVKIRSYKTVGKTRYYGAFSSIRSTKAK